MWRLGNPASFLSLDKEEEEEKKKKKKRQILSLDRFSINTDNFVHATVVCLVTR